jgi:hypothetical protein
MFYRYLFVVLALLSLPLTASVIAPKNYHPALNMLPLEALAQLNAEVADEVPLLDADLALEAHQLHHLEAHPADWARLVGAASFDFASLEAQNPEHPMPPGGYLSYRLTVDKQQYHLSVVEVFADTENQFRYVTAKLVGHQGYARFVVSNQTGHVAAQLSIDRASYRMLSRQTSASQQLIYRLQPAATQQGQWGNNEPLSKANVQPIHRLESELLRTELLLKIAPTYYSYSDASIHKSYLEGLDLGFLDITHIQEGAMSPEISEYLSELKLLTQSAQDNQFLVTKVSEFNGAVSSIVFMQVVNGAIFYNKSSIGFRSDDQVGNMRLYLLDRTDAPPARFSQQEALDRAIEKLGAAVSSSDLPLYINPERPPSKYNYTASDQTIRLMWLITIYGQTSTEDESYLVVIDDRTGEVASLKGKAKGH